VREPASNRTRDSILDAAERLFAQQGFGAVSLRAITSAAGANVAAINYHFATKERLFEAVFERRIRPLNRARLELLQACHERHGGRPPIEEVVRAFVEPYVRLVDEHGAAGAVVQQFLGRLFIEPGPEIQHYLLREFDAIWSAFSTSLRAALPGLDERSIYWRFSHMMGVMYFYLAGRQWLAIRTAR
jgi:AcrR family transcriptional regulator